MVISEEQEKIKLEKIKKIQSDNDAIAVMDYDQKRKIATIRQKEKESQIARETRSICFFI